MRAKKEWWDGLSRFFNKLNKICKGNFSELEQNLKIAYLVLGKGYKLLDRKNLTDTELEIVDDAMKLTILKVHLITENLIHCEALAYEQSMYIIQYNCSSDWFTQIFFN